MLTTEEAALVDRSSAARVYGLVNSAVDRTLAGKRVLVTGATGFLGTHLLRRLLGAGAEVFATSHGPPPALHGGVRWQQADLAHAAAAKQVFEQAAPEIVFQLSGRANASRERDLVYPTFASDVMATLHMLMAAADKPLARFVMTASLEEPGPGEIPTSPYAAAKVASTSYGRMFQFLYGVPVVLVRPYMSYGPGQHERKIIPYVIQALLTGQPPRLGSGDRRVDWIFVGDVIDGCIAAALSEGVEGMTFDLGSGELVSIRDMAEMLVRLTGTQVRPEFLAEPARAHERVRRADLGEARNRLGWEPKTSLEEGLRQTLDFFRNRGDQAVSKSS